MADYADELRPKFIVSAGDNFYWNGVVNEFDPQWESSFSAVFASAVLLRTPWYIIAGNHDYHGNLTAQLRYPFERRWNFPSLNYTKLYMMPDAQVPSDCMMIVFADTCPYISYYRTRPENIVVSYHHTARAHLTMACLHINSAVQMEASLNASDPTAQLQWFSEQLNYASATCKAVLVYGHHPVYSGGSHGNSDDLIEKFLPLFNATSVSAYIAGHDHTLIHLKENDIDFIVSGGGSDIRDDTAYTPQTVWFENSPGFTVHSINATHAYHAWVRADRVVIHDTLRPLRSTPAA